MARRSVHEPGFSPSKEVASRLCSSDWQTRYLFCSLTLSSNSLKPLSGFQIMAMVSLL